MVRISGGGNCEISRGIGFAFSCLGAALAINSDRPQFQPVHGDANSDSTDVGHVGPRRVIAAILWVSSATLGRSGPDLGGPT